MKILLLFMFSMLFLAAPVCAADYPNMVGTWVGNVRIVSSGAAVANQVVRGGAVITEVELRVTFDHQEGETFIGSSRASNTPKNQASTPVWGALRSTGDEAMFVTADGGRGHFWLRGDNEVEYCITNLRESIITAYCAIIRRVEE